VELSTPVCFDLSLVIPVLDEQESLVQLHRQIVETADAQGWTFELIFVDDGSRDQSWQMITTLARQDPRVRGIRFRRNFGKAAALSAGFANSRGTFVVTLDADLQDDPAEIPKLISELAGGSDVVSGWKQTRHDPWHKRWPSKAFNWLVGWLSGVRIHDHNCGLKAYRREVLSEVPLYGELHRFIPVLAAARGFRVSEVVVRHRPRQHGQSKYGVSRLTKGLLDIVTVNFLTGYGQRPLHWMGRWGLLAVACSAAGLIYLSAGWIWSRMHQDIPDWHLHQRALFYFSILGLILGAQLVVTGLLAELLVAEGQRPKRSYAIRETTDR